MRKAVLLAVLSVLLTGCASILLNDEWIQEYGSMSSITVQLAVSEGRNNIIIQPVEIVKAIFELIDPVSNIQSRVWTPASNSTMMFSATRNGSHGIRITDIDAENKTNVMSTNFNFVAGYNYRILVNLGGDIIAIETNIQAEIINPLLAFVLYAETLTKNVVWPTDINTNQSPSSPNVISFDTTTAGEGSESFKIKVNTLSFEVNFLRYPLVTYLDLTAYSAGTLRFMIKAPKDIAVGIHMVANYDIMEKLTNGMYGFKTNNTWCSVSIPISNFVNRGVDITRLYGWVKFYGGSLQGISGGEEYYIDRVFFYKQ